jgi:hypothetical protein
MSNKSCLVGFKTWWIIIKNLLNENTSDWTIGCHSCIIWEIPWMIGRVKFWDWATLGSICRALRSPVSLYRKAWLGKVITLQTRSGFLLGICAGGGYECFPLNPKPPRPRIKIPRLQICDNYFLPSLSR